MRYKKDLQPFGDGLSAVRQLRPVAFTWKADNTADIGLAAEDVARVNPLLVTYNDKGDVEGVKYDRLGVLFVNAFKEQEVHLEQQRQQLEQQHAQLEQQRRQIEGLTQLICLQHPEAAMCHDQTLLPPLTSHPERRR